MDSIMTTAAWVKKFAKFKDVKKTGLASENRATKTTSPMTAGNEPMSPLRTFIR
jgi:hypothetical protein